MGIDVMRNEVKERGAQRGMVWVKSLMKYEPSWLVRGVGLDKLITGLDSLASLLPPQASLSLPQPHHSSLLPPPAPH